MASARVLAAHARDAKQRHADYKNPIRVNGTEGTGIYNPPRSMKTLREGGFLGENDAKVRLLKSEWSLMTSRHSFDTATIELWLNSAWVAFTVANVIDIHQSGEWKLELHAKVC